MSDYSGGYNQGYNGGYNQQQQGYDQQGYGQQGYNQGYGQQGYNQGYDQQHQQGYDQYAPPMNQSGGYGQQAPPAYGQSGGYDGYPAEKQGQDDYRLPAAAEDEEGDGERGLKDFFYKKNDDEYAGPNGEEPEREISKGKVFLAGAALLGAAYVGKKVYDNHKRKDLEEQSEEIGNQYGVPPPGGYSGSFSEKHSGYNPYGQ